MRLPGNPTAQKAALCSALPQLRRVFLLVCHTASWSHGCDRLSALAGLGPAPARNAAHDRYGSGKRAGGAMQRHAEPAASAAALAAAQYWREKQENESMEGEILAGVSAPIQLSWGGAWLNLGAVPITLVV